MSMKTEEIKIEEIKVGEMYNVRVRVVKNDFGDTGEIATVTVDENGKEIDGEIAYYTEADAASFSPITPENGTKNTDPAPKYDPCRKFRKGDKVRVVEYKGRCKKSHCLRVGDILSIADDEANDDTFIARCERNNTDFYLDPAYLELVTPVEEIEPFTCGESIDGCILYKNGDYYAEFLNSEDAQRACKLLNEEYRKEQE